MKKILAIVFIMISLNMAKAQYVTIPDTNFAAYLNAQFPSIMSGGNQLDTTNPLLSNIYHIEVRNLNIYDLTGIQYFHALTSLDCSFNYLTSLPQLGSGISDLSCEYNDLDSLPALGSAISYLDCQRNNLNSLPDLSNSSLMILVCASNSIDSIPQLPSTVYSIDCSQNELTSLPVLPDSLDWLDCSANFLTGLPALPAGLTGLQCVGNDITSLPVLPQSLDYLHCGYNNLTSLPTLPANLTELYCYVNQLTSLPALPSKLDVLHCYYNMITTIPTLPDSLTKLFCPNNQIHTLPPLPSTLKELNCRYNLLSSLPVLPDSLTSLICSYNYISCLPVLPSTLTTLQFEINDLTCIPNYVSCMNSGQLAYHICISGDIINNPDNCTDVGQGVTGFIFTDNNSNCVNNFGDTRLYDVHEFLYDSAGNIIAQTFSAINGIYDFYKGAGTYTVKIDTTGMPFNVQCVSPGIDSTVTLTTGNPLVEDVDFSIMCKPGFDVGANSVVTEGDIFPGDNHNIKVIAGDMSQWYNLACALGISGQIQITISGPVTYIGIIPGSMTPVVSGNVFTYNISDFGTVDIRNSFGLTFITNTTAQAGDTVCVNVNVTPTAGDNETTNNNYDYCYYVVNSYDPNMKEVYPVNVTPGYQDYFTYTVHFQNTGNATAHNIRIVDTLSNNLDLPTFQMINYSHINNVTIENNVLTVRFPDIQLPDNTSNPEASTGWFQYRIKPIQGLSSGTQIMNRAFIYFDYNVPVITNTTINQYLFPLHAANSEINNPPVFFPNPASEKITIANLTGAGEGLVSISDIRGNKLKEIKFFDRSSVEMSVRDINPGIYLLKIQTSNGVEVLKLLKN